MQGTGQIWYSQNSQAFHSYVNAELEIRRKSPLELEQLKASVRAQLSNGGEDGPEFGDGSMDYMMQRQGNLALINVNGTLVKNHSYWNRYYGLLSYQELRQAICLALEDREVDGITLMMNTPGGSASGADAMASFFGRAGKQKPIYTYAETDMCSGGYYLGAPTQRIYAQRAASVGSIGVIMVHFSYLKMYQEAGIEPTVLRAGEFKALGSHVEKLDEKARASLEKTIQDYFSMFNEHVVKYRKFGNMDSFLSSAGEGRVFLGEEAKEVGLVDQVAELEEALESMSDRASKDAGRRQQFAVSNQLRGSAMSKSAAKGVLPKDTANLTEQQLAALAAGVALEDLGGEAAAETSASDAPNGEQATNQPAEPAAAVAAAASVEEPEAPAPAAAAAQPAADMGNLDKVIELSTQLGTAKADVTRLEGQLAEANAKLTAANQTSENLLAVARVAVNNRQVALGYQPSDLQAMDANQTVELFGKLDADFKNRYKPGQKSEPSQEAVKAAGGTLSAAAKNLTKV